MRILPDPGGGQDGYSAGPIPLSDISYGICKTMQFPCRRPVPALKDRLPAPVSVGVHDLDIHGPALSARTCLDKKTSQFDWKICEQPYDGSLWEKEPVLWEMNHGVGSIPRHPRDSGHRYFSSEAVAQSEV